MNLVPRKFTSGFSLFAVAVSMFNMHPQPAPPAISYTSPQVYKTGVPITPLVPVNTGGLVPATHYSQTETFAGTGNFGAVYEDFEKDIFSALEQMKDRLSKYHTIKIIFPQHTCYSKKILLGFLRFCNQYSFKHAILNCLHQEEIETGSVYINLAEDDLVILVEKIVNRNLKPGRDVGVISYNETPVKKVIMDGITTISTDFGLMGEKAAELVLTNSVERSAIPFKVTLRNSI